MLISYFISFVSGKCCYGKMSILLRIWYSSIVSFLDRGFKVSLDGKFFKRTVFFRVSSQKKVIISIKNWRIRIMQLFSKRRDFSCV